MNNSYKEQNMVKSTTVYKIGCSGFSYPEWKNNFYPQGLRPNKWLSYYSEHFNTVELNVTFYRTMKPVFFKRLYNEVPGNFIFSVKAPRLITHFKKFNNTGEDIQSFYRLVEEGLQDKLGCILFQLPPSLLPSEELVQSILSQMDSRYKNVLEFRNAGWWNKKTYDALKEKDLSFCTTSYPGLPDTLIKTNSLLYVRLHGVPELYKSGYSKKYLQDLATGLKKTRGKNEVYIYFDNTMYLNAIQNAKTMLELLFR